MKFSFVRLLATMAGFGMSPGMIPMPLHRSSMPLRMRSHAAVHRPNTQGPFGYGFAQQHLIGRRSARRRMIAFCKANRLTWD